MRLFERFADTKEEGFREEFIKPLLIRMGFLGISNKHGVNEFGKDYVFSELDRFGFFRHLTVQAKHEEKLNQGKKVDDLISQIKQCFYVPYTLPTAPTEQRYVSAVYIFNSGDITDNAETQIRHSLPREIASNTRFFGGHHLEILAQSIAQRQDEDIRMRLQALDHQLQMNIVFWTSLKQGINPDIQEQSYDVRGPFLHGIEAFLTRPIMPHRINPGEVSVLWQEAQIIRSLVMRHVMRTINLPQEQVSKDLRLVVEMCDKAISHAVGLIANLLKALEELPPPTI